MANWIVVKGKKVDLEKATLLGVYQFANPSDFNYVREELYKTAKGNYLLVGEGGANSKYAEQIATRTSAGGEKKYFISKEEAIRLLEKWHEEESLLEEFGDELEEA